MVPGKDLACYGLLPGSGLLSGSGSALWLWALGCNLWALGCQLWAVGPGLWLALVCCSLALLFELWALRCGLVRGPAGLRGASAHLV